MAYGWMYSGMSPSFSTKFWKKELVGSGAARSVGAKKRDGFGTTVDVVRGNTGPSCTGAPGRWLLLPWWCGMVGTGKGGPGTGDSARTGGWPSLFESSATTASGILPAADCLLLY